MSISFEQMTGDDHLATRLILNKVQAISIFIEVRLKIRLQINDYEIVINSFISAFSHNLTGFSAIVHKFTKIYPVFSNYELTKQFM